MVFTENDRIPRGGVAHASTKRERKGQNGCLSGGTSFDAPPALASYFFRAGLAACSVLASVVRSLSCSLPAATTPCTASPTIRLVLISPLASGRMTAPTSGRSTG